MYFGPRKKIVFDCIGGTKCISTVFLVVHVIEMHANIKYRSVLKKNWRRFYFGRRFKYASLKHIVIVRAGCGNNKDTIYNIFI